MTMYPKALVEAMVSLAEVRSTLVQLHESITDEIGANDDTAINNMVDSLGEIQEKLMSIGTEVYEPEAPNFRKVTLETRPSA